ncbi:MAG: hypothetical protein M3Z36_13025, partial [Acidobacteriota bacterium]|nr:hypothetical protein [Acidobacteriota bacterium]
FNVRQYAVTGVRVTTKDGKITVAPETPVQLFATARDPIDTAVVWSLDPTSIEGCPSAAASSTATAALPATPKCPTISESGLFTAPKERTYPGPIGILATNRRDRTKVGRIELTIGKEAPAGGGSGETNAGGTTEEKPVKTPGTP